MFITIYKIINKILKLSILSKFNFLLCKVTSFIVIIHSIEILFKLLKISNKLNYIRFNLKY